MRVTACGLLCAALLGACGDDGKSEKSDENGFGSPSIDGGTWPSEGGASFDGDAESPRPAPIDVDDISGDVPGFDAGSADAGSADASELSLDAGSADAGDLSLDAGSADADDASLDAGSADEGVADEGGGGAGDNGGGKPVTRPPNPVDVLVGHYAMRARSATVARVLNRTIKTQGTSYLTVEIAKRNGRLVWTQRACRAEVDIDPSENGATIADAVFANAPAVEAELSAQVVGKSLTWRRAEASFALGFRDTDPRLPVPTSPSDSRVYDLDQDGKPGFTVQVRTKLLVRHISGETYNAQRTTDTMHGTFEGGRLTGEQTVKTDNRVLDATKSVFKFALDQARDEAGDHSVLLVPTASSLTCPTLLGRIKTLFPE